jgi:tetratricopeptide (TPR) repeat protein
MDSLINAAARALAAGDPLGALNRVALRDDAAALALRGIAMAQLGEFARAKTLLRSAARRFGAKEAVARSRCVVAEAEIALASRDLAWPQKALDAARVTLEAHGDHVNAVHARILAVRRLALLGRLDDARLLLASLDALSLPPASEAARELIAAAIAIRRVETQPAREALTRAREAAHRSGIAALEAEAESASSVLDAPAARRIARGEARLLRLDEVEALFASAAFIVDACRNVVREGGVTIALATRPVLFTLARALAEAWPDDVPRDTLIVRAFRMKHADDTHRARLRVEIGRLRTMLQSLATVSATPRGFTLTPRRADEVVVLAQPTEDAYATLLAVLADGQTWSSSALALALGSSQRTVQRGLTTLAAAGKVQAYGQGRARRWMTAPLPGFTTALLLPAGLAYD